MSRHRRVQQPTVKMGFPSMSVDELCACLAALGIAAHPEDLNKPTTQSAQAIYAGLLDALMSANSEGLEQPKAVLLSTMEYKVGGEANGTRWMDGIRDTGYAILMGDRTSTLMGFLSQCISD